MTDAERILWTRIRRKQINGLQFYRQKPIGDYIVDFYCASARLVIELDGGQHYVEAGAVADQQRDNNLKNLDLRVVRFSNLEVLTNIEGVLAEIAKCVRS